MVYTTTRFHIRTVVVVLTDTTLLLPPLLLLLPIAQSATLLFIVHDLYIPAAYKYKEISITESNVRWKLLPPNPLCLPLPPTHVQHYQ
jgi:hypothetical protein